MCYLLLHQEPTEGDIELIETKLILLAQLANNNKRSLFTINLIHYTIYLPQGCELKNENIYKFEIKPKICEYNYAVSIQIQFK